MGLTDRYKHPDDLPRTIPVFPLSGALLLPRGQMPLNIFEPRYLRMIDDAMAGNRIIGMVQPNGEAAQAQERDPKARPDLYEIGCAGRITTYSELEDGRLFITLTGICRFRITRELDCLTPYRQCAIDAEPFFRDLEPGFKQEDVERDRLLTVLKEYLDRNGFQADWDAIKAASNEALVNSLCMISPYGPREKQALLEADTLRERNEILIALTEMVLAQDGETSSTVQ